jgi:hypothetical protein
MAHSFDLDDERVITVTIDACIKINLLERPVALTTALVSMRQNHNSNGAAVGII